MPLGTILSMTRLTIRPAAPTDTAALAHLAALDSSDVPAEPVLVADLGGRLVAAVSVEDGAAIADPFTRSADAVELLRSRARQVTRRSARPRRHFALRAASV
jgi:hypothetical protein